MRRMCEVVDIYRICFSLFFFQAEDGIRDLVRSRGLGDVYKRQVYAIPVTGHEGLARATLPCACQRFEQLAVAGPLDSKPVSYTHLTLPTSDLV